MARKPATDYTAKAVTRNADKTGLPRRPSPLAVSASTPERHFAVPEFKVVTAQRDRSFVLGYN